MTVTLTAPQQQVVDCINQLNEEHGVASALYVAARLNLQQTYVNQLCHSLKQLGVVTWEPNVPSLRVILPVEVEPPAAPADGETEGGHGAEPDEDDEAERKKQAQRDALARGRATAAANRAAKAAAQH